MVRVGSKKGSGVITHLAMTRVPGIYRAFGREDSAGFSRFGRRARDPSVGGVIRFV
jgi:hypothetical protein